MGKKKYRKEPDFFTLNKLCVCLANFNCTESKKQKQNKIKLHKENTV